MATNTWKCANSIGKLVSDNSFGTDVNEIAERPDHWFKQVNQTIDSVDLVIDVVSLQLTLNSLIMLKKVSAKHSGAILTKYSRKQSVQAYKELMEAGGEAFTNQQVKRAINGRGYSVRFTPKSVPKEAARYLDQLVVDVIDANDDATKSGLKWRLNRLDDRATRSAVRPQPTYRMHILQQASP